jgi:uncharacterized protein HemX
MRPEELQKPTNYQPTSAPAKKESKTALIAVLILMALVAAWGVYQIILKVLEWENAKLF